MGCANEKERLENRIIEMNIDKIEIQMEKYQKMQLLGKDANDVNTFLVKGESKPNDTLNEKNVTRKKRAMSMKATKKANSRKSKSSKTVRIQNNTNNNKK